MALKADLRPGSTPSPPASIINSCRAPGKNAVFGRRGALRTPLDLAADAKHWVLYEWLRAEGCKTGDGPIAKVRVAEWQAAGWRGDVTGSRSWSTSWSASWRKEGWKEGGWKEGSWKKEEIRTPPSSPRGHEPSTGSVKEEPASSSDRVRSPTFFDVAADPSPALSPAPFTP